jgi:hypothetical protein
LHCHFPILYDHNVSPRSGQSRFQQVKSEPGQPIAMLHDNPNHLGIPQEVSFVFRSTHFGHHFNLCPTVLEQNLPFQILFLVSGGH